MSAVRRDGADLVLHCVLQPRASRDEIIGEHDGALRIRITAPPVDGEANAALVRFLARRFKTGKQAITIESGETSRRKRVRVASPRQMPDEIALILANQ